MEAVALSPDRRPAFGGRIERRRTIRRM